MAGVGGVLMRLSNGVRHRRGKDGKGEQAFSKILGSHRGRSRTVNTELDKVQTHDLGKNVEGKSVALAGDKEKPRESQGRQSFQSHSLKGSTTFPY